MFIYISFIGITSKSHIHDAIEELKITIGELLVAVGNIVRTCFRLFFKLHQNSLLLLLM
jgi:hypothetical protein